MSSAFNRQEGGQHYKGFAIQPAEFIHRNGIGFMEGNAIKYACRHREKNGAQDIKKAIHYLEMLLEMDYPDRDTVGVCTCSHENRPCAYCQERGPHGTR